ncbi:MAG: hypothetical protein ACK5YR_19900 [Pirellula sp.]
MDDAKSPFAQKTSRSDDQEDEEATTYSNVLFFDHPAGGSEWHVIFSGKTQRPRCLGHYI